MKVTNEQIEKLEHLKKFDTDLFVKLVNENIEEWIKYSDECLNDLALIRVIECTNGCVQYAFRDKVSYALSVEQSRECMKLSMGFIKNKSLTLPTGEIIDVNPDIHPLMEKVRDMYLDGFKRNMPHRIMEFYAQSTAQFYACGRQRLEDKLEFVKNHFSDIFTNSFLNHGRDYMFQYLEALNV